MAGLAGLWESLSTPYGEFMDCSWKISQNIDIRMNLVDAVARSLWRGRSRKSIDLSDPEPDVCTLLDQVVLTAEARRRGSRSGRIRSMPLLLKTLLFLGILGFGAMGLRILPATASEGWVPTAALLGALGLIAIALFEVVRGNERNKR
jgi:hypothetical protein